VLTAAAAVLLGVLGRAAFLYFSPYRECRWCRPARMAGASPEKRRRGCWRCGGTKLTRRFGAYHVHKVKLSLLQAWDERGWWR
jgi:hypothetical protein